MSYIKIEKYSIHETAGARHTLAEFKKLYDLKDPEKAYIAVGGTIKKAKKDSDKEEIV